jgi:uncharacterized protein YaiL (DUF2058 family)
MVHPVHVNLLLLLLLLVTAAVWCNHAQLLLLLRTVCAVHGNAAHVVVTHVLRNLQHKADVVVLHLLHSQQQQQQQLPQPDYDWPDVLHA